MWWCRRCLRSRAWSTWPRQASGVQEDDDLWLEQRTAALDRMLKRIYAHPLLSGSPSLQACLMTRTRTRALTPQP